MLQRNYILGERKPIKLRATSCDGEPVIITSALYRLYRGDTLLTAFPCDIRGPEITAMIEPPAVGDYILEIEYTIAPEVRKVRVFIRVT